MHFWYVLYWRLCIFLRMLYIQWAYLSLCTSTHCDICFLMLSPILTLSLSIAVPPLHFPTTLSNASTHSLTISLTIYLIHRLTDRLHVFPTPSVSSTPIISCTYNRKRIKVFYDFDCTDSQSTMILDTRRAVLF